MAKRSLNGDGATYENQADMLAKSHAEAVAARTLLSDLIDERDDLYAMIDPDEPKPQRPQEMRDTIESLTAENTALRGRVEKMEGALKVAAERLDRGRSGPALFIIKKVLAESPKPEAEPSPICTCGHPQAAHSFGAFDLECSHCRCQCFVVLTPPSPETPT